MGFSRQFTGGFEDVAGARRFVADTLLRDTEVYEAARLLVDEAITNPLLHSEACGTTRAFQVTIAFRPTCSTSRSTTEEPRYHSAATPPDPPRSPGAAWSCSTPWPSTGPPPPRRTAPATWSGSSWKPDQPTVVGSR
jgi:hypothetical protein